MSLIQYLFYIRFTIVYFIRNSSPDKQANLCFVKFTVKYLHDFLNYLSDVIHKHC